MNIFDDFLVDSHSPRHGFHSFHAPAVAKEFHEYWLFGVRNPNFTKLIEDLKDDKIINILLSLTLNKPRKELLQIIPFKDVQKWAKRSEGSTNINKNGRKQIKVDNKCTWWKHYIIVEQVSMKLDKNLIQLTSASFQT